MKKLTDEQREWIINHPDYPPWVIVENFKERFGIECPVQKNSISIMRRRIRGTSNIMDGRSKLGKRGKSNQRYQEDFKISQIEFLENSDPLYD